MSTFRYLLPIVTKGHWVSHRVCLQNVDVLSVIVVLNKNTIPHFVLKGMLFLLNGV